MLRVIVIVVIVILIGIQFIPVSRTNPPVTGEIKAPGNVMQVLRNSCYDCHSNETIWPWYSKLAPVSWLVTDDVDEGREHLNFSEWQSYSSKDKAENIKEIWEETEEGDMPLWFYLPLHPEVRLTAEDKDILKNWVQGGGPQS